jgi:DeoR/GlpR family transcriptional regulator of sugar metabolism
MSSIAQVVYAEVPKLPASMRHEFILQEIEKRGFVTAVDIAQRLAVSEMTLRRDLDQLARAKKILRSHGGAVAIDPPSRHVISLIEPSLESREAQKHDAKLCIAACALGLIGSSKTVAIDIGSTTLALAQSLDDSALRVFTSSLRIATALKQTRNEVYLPNGKIYGTEPSIVGSGAVEFLRNQHFDVAFLGTSGVTESGFYDYSFEDTDVKRVLIERSQRTVLLMDDSKFNRTSATLIARLNAIDDLICNSPLPETLHNACVTAGVQVHIAPSLASANLRG